MLKEKWRDLNKTEKQTNRSDKSDERRRTDGEAKIEMGWTFNENDGG